jgi:hypothetical protein
VPSRTIRPQGLVPLPSPLQALLRKRCEAARYSLGLSIWGVRVLLPDLYLRVQVQAPAAAAPPEGDSALPDGQLVVVAPVSAVLPKECSFVERASTGHAGLRTKWSSPPWVDAAPQLSTEVPSAALLVRGLEPVAETTVSCPIRLRLPRAEARCDALSDSGRFPTLPKEHR